MKTMTAHRAYRSQYPLSMLTRLLMLLGLALMPALLQGQYARKSVLEVIDLNGVEVGSLVDIYGTVDRVDYRQDGKVDIYILRGDEGGEIEIQTTLALPQVNSRVESAKGTVTLRPGGREVFLFEVSRGFPIIDQTDEEFIPPSFWELYQAYILTGAAAVMILLGGLLIYLLKRPPAAQFAAPVGDVAGGAVPTPVPSPMPGGAADDSEITVRKNDVTVRINDEATIVFLPAHLEVASGGGKGQKIPLCGGYRITIGRKHSKARGPNFIGLDDVSNALSRNQATITFDKAADRFYVESQNPPNPTQVNKAYLAEGQSVVLDDGAEIALPGDYVFIFRRGLYRRNA